jgi:hypothetical protein
MLRAIVSGANPFTPLWGYGGVVDLKRPAAILRRSSAPTAYIAYLVRAACSFSEQPSRAT